jgi:hypothetical protein
MIFKQDVQARQKNNKIQIYAAEPIAGTKPVQLRKRYLYNAAQYAKGGIWAYVRDLSTSERQAAQVNGKALMTQFIINNRETVFKERGTMYIELSTAGQNEKEVYQVIGPPDRYEYGVNDIILATERKTDINQYAETTYTVV